MEAYGQSGGGVRRKRNKNEVVQGDSEVVEGDWSQWAVLDLGCFLCVVDSRLTGCEILRGRAWRRKRPGTVARPA